MKVKSILVEGVYLFLISNLIDNLSTPEEIVEKHVAILKNSIKVAI